MTCGELQWLRAGRQWCPELLSEDVATSAALQRLCLWAALLLDFSEWLGVQRVTVNFIQFLLQSNARLATRQCSVHSQVWRMWNIRQGWWTLEHKYARGFDVRHASCIKIYILTETLTLKLTSALFEKPEVLWWSSRSPLCMWDVLHLYSIDLFTDPLSATRLLPVLIPRCHTESPSALSSD